MTPIAEAEVVIVLMTMAISIVVAWHFKETVKKKNKDGKWDWQLT
jgi:flagellar basal body-associated protein FliL